MTPTTRPTPADVEAARLVYDAAESSACEHWFMCPIRHDPTRSCRACDELEAASLTAFWAYRAAAHREAGLGGGG